MPKRDDDLTHGVVFDRVVVPHLELQTLVGDGVDTHVKPELLLPDRVVAVLDSPGTRGLLFIVKQDDLYVEAIF